MARDEHHVIHNPNGGWDVKRNNAQRASLHTETKAEAVKAGRQISRNQGTEFVVHGMNGRIQNSDSHGNDPYPPRDRKCNLDRRPPEKDEQLEEDEEL